MGYSDSYNSAKNRYNNACSEARSCENRIKELKVQRQQKINQINKLKTDIKNHEEALEGIGQMLNKNSSMDGKVSTITNRTSQASEIFNIMVKASDVVKKILNEVYETNSTKLKLNNIFENIKAKQNALKAKLLELKDQLRRAESELRDIESSIKRKESDLRDWESRKRGASEDMAYYSKKMSEEDDED